MKIAIIVRSRTLEKCTGRGCLNAFANRSDAFKSYGKEAELVAFTHDGGDLQHKIENLKRQGVEVVHLSTCLRGKSAGYEALAQKLSRDFDVVGYTHGTFQGRTREAICLNRKSK